MKYLLYIITMRLLLTKIKNIYLNWLIICVYVESLMAEFTSTMCKCTTIFVLTWSTLLEIFAKLHLKTLLLNEVFIMRVGTRASFITITIFEVLAKYFLFLFTVWEECFHIPSNAYIHWFGLALVLKDISEAFLKLGHYRCSAIQTLNYNKWLKYYYLKRQISDY
jgi:hypothetical protein